MNLEWGELFVVHCVEVKITNKKNRLEREKKMNLDEKKEQAKTELRKAFKLAVEGVDVKMFSKFIDNVWHQMRNDPASYEDFSLEACGHVITHAEESGEGAIEFIKIYEEKYGKMPDVWFMDKEGELDIENFVNHIEGRSVITGWDCNPTHNC